MTDRAWRTWRPIDWALLAAALLAAAYLATKMRTSDKLIDIDGFRFAGWMWNHGLNPYGADFQRLKQGWFGQGETPVSFVYPPHFWVIAAPLGLFGRDAGRALGDALNILLLAGGHVLCWRLARAAGLPALRLVLASIIALCVFTGTGAAIYNGQTSFLVWFGFVLLAYGLVFEKSWLAALALAILLLKPHVGLVVGAAIVLPRLDVRLALQTIAIVVIASIPALLIGGTGSLLDLAHGLGGYHGFSYNEPTFMTGAGNLSVVWLHREIPAMALEGVAILAALAAALVVRRALPGDGRGHVVAIMVAISLFVPLHSYDLMFVPLAALILLPPKTTAGRVLTAIGFALFLRAENLDHIPRLGDFATIVTIGSVLLTLVPLVERIRRRASPV